MLKNYISLFIFLISLNLLLNNCTDNITYSGKIIDTNYNYKLIKTKEELIKTFGKPSYIDIIDKNY